MTWLPKNWKPKNLTDWPHKVDDAGEPRRCYDIVENRWELAEILSGKFSLVLGGQEGRALGLILGEHFKKHTEENKEDLPEVIPFMNHRDLLVPYVRFESGKDTTSMLKAAIEKN